MSKPILFANLRRDSAFVSAIPGDPKPREVYVKKENGICPVVSKENRWILKDGLGVTYEQAGIFHPYDRVYPVNVPSKILYHYR